MFSNFSAPLLQLFISSFWETLAMVGISGAIGALVGVPLGVYLRLSDRGGVLERGAMAPQGSFQSPSMASASSAVNEWFVLCL